MIGDFLGAWMEQEAGVTTVIGEGDQMRFFPQNVPHHQDDFPRVTYLVVSDEPVHHLQGRAGTNRAIVRIDCWAKGPGGYDVAEDLAIAIHGTSEDKKLDGYRGTLAGIFVQACLMSPPGKQDLSEPPAAGSDLWVYRVGMEFRITYNEH